MAIRKARAKDYPMIEEIVKQVKLFDYSLFCRFLIWCNRVFVLTIKEKVVAFISYLTLPFSQHVFALQLGVAPGNQGNGLGVKLLTHLKAVGAKLHHARYVWGHTLKPKALAWFCKKMKWKVVGSAFGVSLIQSPKIKKKMLTTSEEGNDQDASRP